MTDPLVRAGGEAACQVFGQAFRVVARRPKRSREPCLRVGRRAPRRRRYGKASRSIASAVRRSTSAALAPPM